VINIKEKINSNALASLVPSLVKASFFGYGISAIFISSKTSSIFSLIIGFILSFVYVLIFLKVYSYKEEMTMLEKIDYLFPKVISIPLIIVILITIFFLSLLIYYLINYFVVSHYLTETPFWLIGIILISSVFYLSTKNYEVLTRVSTILTIVSIVMLLVNIFGLLPYSEMNNILPLYNFENKKIVKSSLIFFSLFSSPLFLITFINKKQITDKEKVNKKIIIHIILSFIVTFIIFYMILSTLGINLIELFSYPEYIALKKINLNFAKSIENICFLVWSIFAYILCTTGVMYLKDSIIDTFKLKSDNINKIIPFIICLFIILIPELLFKDNHILTGYIYGIAPIILGGVLCGIVLLMFPLIKLKK